MNLFENKLTPIINDRRRLLRWSLASTLLGALVLPVLMTPFVQAEEDIAEAVSNLNQGQITTIDPNAVADTSATVEASKKPVTEAAVKAVDLDLSTPDEDSNLGFTQQIPAPSKSKEPLPLGAEISKGERTDIDGKGFSIVAPMDWVVQKNMARSSLYMQAQTDNSGYLRNISVVRFKGPKFLNETTADEFAEKLVKTFPTVSTTIQNYTLRNRQSIQMADGRDGYLFYTDFDGSGRKMMQAHVLLSSQTYHYLVTYTDVLEHFESSADGSQFLSEAWAAMTSIQLDSPNPVPGADMNSWVFGFIGVFAVMGVVFISRKQMAAKKYREYGNLSPGEAHEMDPASQPAEMLPSEGATQLSQMNSDVADCEDFEEEVLNEKKSERIVEFSPKKQSLKSISSENDGLEFSDEATPIDSSKKFKKGA